MHPAIHGANPHDGDSAFVLPEYLERDHDRRLRNHLAKAAAEGQPTLVVVRGESCVGKTRTAFDAVRACLDDWQLVFPKTAKRLLALLDADALAPRTVLWLNEAQNYLTGTDGEAAAAALHSRVETPGPVVIICTLWPEYHRSLTATATPQPDRDTHRHARALLGQAKLVDVPAFFTAQALTDPRVSRDRSLATAARASTGGRITQTLAVGPQLVDHYEHAAGPQGTYGKAIITAAMDARRLGHTSPLPSALLRAAAPGYLTADQRAAAPGTWFADALEYARTKVKGVAAALEPVANPDGMGALPDVYRLAGYLDHHARETRHYAFPPGSFWTAVRDHAAGVEDLRRCAVSARYRSRYRIAADLYQRGAHAGDVAALRELAELREQAGDIRSAERLYGQAADAGDTQAMRTLAKLRERAGDTDGARRLYRRALGVWALQELTERRERSGDSHGAQRFAQQAADAGYTGPMEALTRIHELARDLRAPWTPEPAAETFVVTNPRALEERAERLERAGDTHGAQQLYRGAVDAGHLTALQGLARMREQAGDAEGAEHLRRFGLEADGSPAQPW
ncbi:hypothetical protein [Streptomyces sp. NPDC048106]|uniref:tetratricopeptide repeat protein n=1 Tax=Streptomyces sp. NPDC048106 TaxID=3155750 RepID=UPI0034557365